MVREMKDQFWLFRHVYHSVVDELRVSISRRQNGAPQGRRWGLSIKKLNFNWASRFSINWATINNKLLWGGPVTQLLKQTDGRSEWSESEARRELKMFLTKRLIDRGLINWLKKINRMLDDQLMIRSLSNSWSPTDQPTWLEIGQLVDLIKNNQPVGQLKNIDH